MQTCTMTTYGAEYFAFGSTGNIVLHTFTFPSSQTTVRFTALLCTAPTFYQFPFTFNSIAVDVNDMKLSKPLQIRALDSVIQLTYIFYSSSPDCTPLNLQCAFVANHLTIHLNSKEFCHWFCRQKKWYFHEKFITYHTNWYQNYFFTSQNHLIIQPKSSM